MTNLWARMMAGELGKKGNQSEEKMNMWVGFVPSAQVVHELRLSITRTSRQMSCKHSFFVSIVLQC